METIIQVLWIILIFSSAIIYAYLVAYYVSKGYHRAKREEVPRELDAITFPKWRRESLKAYGNAIVPQVAMMIFSAINEIESNSYEDLH